MDSKHDIDKKYRKHKKCKNMQRIQYIDYNSEDTMHRILCIHIAIAAGRNLVIFVTTGFGPQGLTKLYMRHWLAGQHPSRSGGKVSPNEYRQDHYYESRLNLTGCGVVGGNYWGDATLQRSVPPLFTSPAVMA